MFIESDDNVVFFKSNPKPTSGQFRAGTLSVPFGKSNLNNSLVSSEIIEGNEDDLYSVVFYFNKSKEISIENFTIEVENRLGKTEFTLSSQSNSIE